MLTVHHADQAEALVDVLAGLLATPPDDPFAADVVAVPSRGVERWVAQQLSRRLGTGGPGRADGVAANIRFPFPGTLLRPALVTAADRTIDPWQPGPLTWQVLAAARAADPTVRLTRAAHIAELFDRYAVYRPSLLHLWRAGHDDHADGRPLDPGQRWQPALWRHVLAGLASAGADPAARIQQAVAELHERPGAADLPGRLAIVAFGALPASALAVLDALAVHRDVHVLLGHPSPAWWRRTAAGPPADGFAPHPRRDVQADHPLLTTWGQVAFETQLAILAGDEGRRLAVHLDASPPLPTTATTLLRRVQLDVRLDRHPAAGEPFDRAPDDRSLQVHACHGFTRQVEVLRDALAHLLDDPGAAILPADIVVLCTDLDRARPLVRSIIGPLPDGGTSSTPRFPLTMADAALDDPLIDALLAVVRTARGRSAATAIVSLASLPPVRRCLGLTDTDIARLDAWTEASGVRWGLDEQQLREAGLPRELEASTWQAALDRILLGFALGAAHEGLGLGDRLPVTSVNTDDAAGVGRLTELVHRLRGLRARLHAPMPASAWTALWREVAEAFLAADPTQPWQQRRLVRLLDRLEAEREAAGVDPVLDVDDAVAALRLAWSDAPAGANWGSGGITVCGLGELRGVPFRVVCLLGLDDDSLRATRLHPDDLLGKQPCVGDRDPRSEQRALLLDALLAARDHLVITCDGHDVRTNQPLPPATPLAELLDVVDHTVGVGASARLVVHHPRQSFADACLRPGALGTAGPWSFDADALDGARARRAGGSGTGALCEVLLPDPAERPGEATVVTDGHGRPDRIELDALIAALVDPTGTFVARGLGVQLPRTREQRSDLPTTKLEALERWQLADRLLQLRGRPDLGREEIDHLWLRRARADGLLPVGRFSARPVAVATELVDGLQRVFDDAELPLRGSEVIDVDVELADGRRLVGTVRDIHRDGPRGPIGSADASGGDDAGRDPVGDLGDVAVIVRTRAGDVRAKDVLAAKVELLALCAAGHPARAMLGGFSAPATVVEPLACVVEPEQAAMALTELAALARRTTRSALPLFVSLSAAWERVFDDTYRKVKTPDQGLGSDHDWSEASQLVWGPELSPRTVEARRALDDGTPARVIAHRLWRLLDGDVS